MTAAELVTELMDGVDRARALGGVEDRDIDFAAEVPDPDVQCALSTAAFSRVLDNLVANAVAAGGPGGVVRVVLGQEARHGLVLRVTDDGPGVPVDFLPRAFDRFTRADEARRSRLGGSGLGLALVRAVAERAGGTASLDNGEDGGAVAVVRVPAV